MSKMSELLEILKQPRRYLSDANFYEKFIKKNYEIIAKLLEYLILNNNGNIKFIDELNVRIPKKLRTFQRQINIMVYRSFIR